MKEKTDSDSALLLNNQSAQTVPPENGQSSKPFSGWILWSLSLTLIPGAVGFLAMSMLLRLPSAPKCPSIFWPLASASVRLHCAEIAAANQNVKDLLQAIALVEKLPQNHPLRGQVDSLIQEWSGDILRLADQSFQGGDLQGAIATARQIPKGVASEKLVEAQISKWESLWQRAENIYKDSEAEIRQRRWQSAFTEAAKLLHLNHEYWSTIKYEELNNLIATTKEESQQLAKAETLANSKVASDLLTAIKISGSIAQESYLYPEAQKLIPTIGQKMLDLAKASLDQRDADAAVDMATQIPESLGMQTVVSDFVELAEARRSAWVGTVSGLETAIMQAQQIDPSRSIYSEAQDLIAKWELEIQDVGHLDKARELASQGTTEHLRAAIVEAQLIPRGNPRGEEARREINRWQIDVETIEDRPFLARAEQFAAEVNNVSSLRAAISEASQIRRGRALYSEAQRKIRNWTVRIDRIQDEPYLERARTLAQNGDFAGAINMAKPIADSGRSLAREARVAIRGWQEQIKSRENWNQARQVAKAGTPQALAQAIKLATRVSRNSPLRIDANIAINRWSQDLLDIARSQGDFSLERAIATAKLIPPGSSAYRTAQREIENWQQLLNPPQPEPLPSEPSISITVPITES